MGQQANKSTLLFRNSARAPAVQSSFVPETKRSTKISLLTLKTWKREEALNLNSFGVIQVEWIRFGHQGLQLTSWYDTQWYSGVRQSTFKGNKSAGYILYQKKKCYYFDTTYKNALFKQRPTRDFCEKKAWKIYRPIMTSDPRKKIFEPFVGPIQADVANRIRGNCITNFRDWFLYYYTKVSILPHTDFSQTVVYMAVNFMRLLSQSFRKNEIKKIIDFTPWQTQVINPKFYYKVPVSGCLSLMFKIVFSVTLI